MGNHHAEEDNEAMRAAERAEQARVDDAWNKLPATLRASLLEDQIDAMRDALRSVIGSIGEGSALRTLKQSVESIERMSGRVRAALIAKVQQ